MFSDIYTWKVIDAIRDGRNVYCVDKLHREILFCPGMVAFELIQLIAEAESDKTERYLFYMEIGESND